MATDLTWKVGGAQGEGIDSTGDIFAMSLNRQGHYVFAYRHFMSLIKGGHTNFKARISARKTSYHGDGLDVLIAFDQLTIDHNWAELNEDGVLIYDSSRIKSPRIPADKPGVHLCPVPVTQMAKEVGSSIMKNMVACGVSAAIVGLKPDIFDTLIQDRFGKKGEKVVQSNRTAIKAGFDYAQKHYGKLKAVPDPVPEQDGKGHLFLTGNEAISMGALFAGCRFLAAYPITPATEILYWALEHWPKYGGKIVQAEDEIAACIMAIGANYAGTRAMTSTSGPGFSLMQEAIGLAGISETPLVIVDVMRGGPGTGLPTKTEQSDLNEMLYGSHGDIPRIVLTPSTVEECFTFTIEAFNLAEKYQCPVIIGSDLFLGMSRQSLHLDDFDLENIDIDRGHLLTDEQLAELEALAYQRYEITESGISPRTIPGQKNGMFTALSNEHSEGSPVEIEDAETRRRMMDKRMKKLQNFDFGENAYEYNGPERPMVTLVGFGSTAAQMKEAASVLTERGMTVGCLTVKVVKPFPDEQVKDILSGAERLVVVENNATGQFADLLKQQVGFHDKISNCLKYDGDPFTVREIVEHAEQFMEVMV